MEIFFVVLVIAILLFMVIDGLITGEVWVRGPRSGFSLTRWAHKRSREDEPVGYWIFMSLYTAGALWLIYLTVMMQ